MTEVNKELQELNDIEEGRIADLAEKPSDEVLNIANGVENMVKASELNSVLIDRLELKNIDDLKKIKLIKAADLAGDYKKQYEFLNDPRLDNITIAIVPKELWLKGKQPSESNAENDLILFNEEYFNGEDKVAWMVHEFAHCASFKDHPEDYNKMSSAFAYEGLGSKYPYPNNQVEAFTFKKQFEYLKQIGAQRDDIISMLKDDYEDEEDYIFFNKILDEVY
jgi:hypothetical protein